MFEFISVSLVYCVGIKRALHCTILYLVVSLEFIIGWNETLFELKKKTLLSVFYFLKKVHPP